MSQDFHEKFGGGAVPLPSDRSTGLVFAAVALIVAWFWRAQPNVLHGALTAAGLLALLALALPWVLRPLNVVWFRFGLLLHKVMNPIVMLALFVIAILPAGLIMQRLRDPLRRKRPAAASYWIKIEPAERSGNSMKNQF